MNKSLQEAREYIKNVKDRYTEALRGLEAKIIEGRDREVNPIPIYLTKFRVKNADSLYLKTKRKIKYDDFNKMTDIGGLRVLCLFNQDIPRVYEYLLNEVFDGKVTLHEVSIYDDAETGSKLSQHAALKQFNNQTKKPVITAEQKASGYKSIHFIISYEQVGQTCSVEVQLRTLLQDVWGELEHALAYKQGNVNHQISRYFHWCR